jgi:catecholate siderophore receptor
MSLEKRPNSLRPRLGAHLALATALGAACLGQAHALEAADKDAIVVTGRRADSDPYADPAAPYRVTRSADPRLTEDLQDTPKSITVLSTAVLEDQGVSSFRDVFRSQPGITLGTGEGGNAFGDRVFIRGYDARNDVYVDGVRDPGVGSRETFAVQQIEILRGPSSAFGGRGTTGGAVSLVSKQPGEGDWGDVEVTEGSDDLHRVTLDANRQLGEHVFVRVNAMSHTADIAGRDYVYNERWGAALAAAYQPNSQLRLGFDYFHLSTQYLPDWGYPYDVANNRPFQVRRENFYGVLSRDVGNTFSDVYSGTLDYVLSESARVHTILRYGQSKNNYTASAPEQPDAEAGTVRANAKRRDAVTDYWVNQSELTLNFATGPISHDVVAGYELSREQTLNRQRAFTECAELPCTGAASNPTLDLWRPDNTIAWGSATDVTGRPIITVETKAAFVLDTLKFSPHWQSFLGLRFDSYSAETSGLSPERTSDSSYLNWHAGLVYKPVETATLYLSTASSSNPPCEQLDAFALDYGGCDTRVTELDPIRNTSWELGAKLLAFGHLNATAALFETARKDVPISLGRGDAPLGVQDQRVVGVEFGLAGDVTEFWSLFAGVSLLDTDITHSSVPEQEGQAFPNVSEQSFTLTSRFELSERAHIGATALYASEKFGGTVAAGTTRVPGYWRFDLFGGYDLADNVELSFNVLNLTDELYYDALYRSATPFVYVAPGRSAQLTLDIDF